jgi:hypothetical protein
MNSKLITIFALAILINLGLTSALVVDADYITIYPGEQGKIEVEIENNEDFDIEDVSVQILLASVLPDGTIVSLPFSVVGSSEKSIDDIREDKDESVSFTLKASTDAVPGDYNIPYLIKYFEEDEDEELETQGSFGLRVSAETEIDFAIEVRENGIVGKEGRISLEIINKGLADIKAVSVEIVPEGFELLSKNKVFIGTVNSDDTDLANFDVLYKSTKPVLNAMVSYKDFDNNDQVEHVTLPFKVYTMQEALELGLIQKNTTWVYIVIVAVIIIAWFIWRRIRKKRKSKKK